MGEFKANLRIFLAASAGVWVFATSGAAQGPGLAMLNQIEAGRWELRFRDVSGAVQSICLANGRRLIQLRHPNVTCEYYVVSDGASDVTVQYTCRGRGYGRTHIHRETGKLVQIESQGIADRFPFDFVAEGRRIGECTI